MIDNVLKELQLICSNMTVRTVMLTGGRSANILYERLLNEKVLSAFSTSQLYFGDERCISPLTSESNYYLAKSILGKSINIKQIIRIKGEAVNPIEEAKRYAGIIPDIIDLVLLSVGEDGHIASLFPKSSLLDSTSKVEFVSDSPKPPLKRISITPLVIRKAKHVIVMAAGIKKAKILIQALEDPIKIEELPVRLTIGRTWVLDRDASLTFSRAKIKNNLNTKIIYA